MPSLGLLRPAEAPTAPVLWGCANLFLTFDTTAFDTTAKASLLMTDSETPVVASPFDGADGELLAAATTAANAAALVCRTVQAELVSADTYTKKDRSPVTVADFAAQAVVSYRLLQQFPQVPMVGEESSAALRTNEGAAIKEQVVRHARTVLGEGVSEAEILEAIDSGADAGGAHGQRWVLDPIDGTKGYLRKQQYAVALGLLSEGVPVLGVLGCPSMERSNEAEASGCLFFARHGQGAFEAAIVDDPAASNSAFDGAVRLGVTEVNDAAGATFCESVESGHSSHDRHSAIAAHLGVTKPSFRIDSQCKYAAVARGQASIYLRLPTSDTYQEKIWDHVAGWAVVTEAGGTVTDIHGNPLDFSLGRTLAKNRGIVATNGKLHDRVISAIDATKP